MNICLLNDSFPPVIDGVANVVMNYASVMSQQLDSNVVVGTPAYPDASYEGYPYKVVAYPSFDTTELVHGYRTGNPLSIREIAQIAEMKPDIIHTHCPAISCVMARVLRKETGAPIVFTYHTKFDVDIARAVGEGILKKETIRIMVNNIEACDDVWVVSEGAGENLRSLGFKGEYRVMPNGVDFPKGRLDEDKVKEFTKDYDVPEEIPLFLFVGRMMKYKGLPLIVDALGSMSRAGKDFRMVFVGGGADAEEMQQKVRDLGIAEDVYYEEDGEKKCTHYDGNEGLTGKVIFAGPEHDREKLRAWNTRADLFLFPSVYDTNGIVVREAAACGLASVLIKGSCAAEGITHGRNGYMIEETAQSMAELLMEVGGDLEHLHEVGQNAMDEIYISWDEAVRLAYDRYKELLEMKNSGEIGVRKHQSFEYLMNSWAAVLDGTEKVFVKKPRELYGGMRDNFEEFRDDFSDSIIRIKETISDNVSDIKDTIADNITEIRDNISENVEGIKENIDRISGKFGGKD